MEFNNKIPNATKNSMSSLIIIFAKKWICFTDLQSEFKNIQPHIYDPTKYFWWKFFEKIVQINSNNIVNYYFC